MKKRNLIKKQRSLFFGLLIFFCTLGTAFSQSAFTYGDVNADQSVTIVDALLTARYSINLIPESFDAQAADVNLDSNIDILDALLIARYAVGLIPALPPGAIIPSPTPCFEESCGPVFQRADNPFKAASQWYVNPLWSAKAAAGGGQSIADNNTAVWINSISAIQGEGGLKWHLDKAVEHGDDLIVFVINNMPNRDCNFYTDALGSELSIAEDGINRYMHEFIDPIYYILSDPAYSMIHVVTILEPGILGSYISNINATGCSYYHSNGGYLDGMQYAINKLNQIESAYIYLDIAHAGWLGWDLSMTHMVSYVTDLVMGTAGGAEGIHGFTTNVGNYIPTKEIFLPDSRLTLTEGGLPLVSADFYEWNDQLDEISYTKELYNAFVDNGFSPSIGMVIDTSRNGWGGPDRPVAVSTSADVNTYVNESRLDRRIFRCNYCNNQNAGIGEPPSSETGSSHLDAYLWIKPPGESDGISTPDYSYDPNNPYARYDRMCGPDEINVYYGWGNTGAMEAAPHVGEWNQAHFEILINNAYPPVQ